MKVLLLLLIFGVTSKIAICDTSPPSSLIVNYLQHLNVPFSYIFTCWNKFESLKLSKILSSSGIRSSFINSKEKLCHSLMDQNLTYYGYVLDFSCPIFRDVLTKSTKRINFRLTRPWLVVGDFQSLSPNIWKSLFNNIKIRLDSNIKIALPLGINNSFKLLDIYNPGFNLGGETVVTEAGFWNGTRLTMHKTSSFYLERRNMTNVTIRSASVVLENNHSGTFEEYMFDSRHKQLDTMSKFHYPIFLLLQDTHNFSHNLTVVEKWFGNLQSGIDGGVAKLLYEDEIDLSSTGGSQRPPRIDVIDYLMPSYHFRPCYIFRNPGSYNPLSNEFLKPFSQTIWYLTVVVATVVCVSIKITYNIESKLFRPRTRYSWATAILITISPLFQQGSSLFPSHYSGRCVFLTLLLTSILLYNYYTSSILSSLLSKSPSAFHTLDELGHSQLEIGIEDLPYTITWFIIMNDSDVQYIYKNKVFPRGATKLNIYPREEGIAKVKRGSFAYHTQLDTGYPIIARTFDQDAICDLANIPMIPQALAGTMIQKKSQYYELFHVTLRKAKQAGLIHRISMIWESKQPECLSNARVIPVGIDQTFIAFLCLMTGMLLSLLFLVVEIIWEKLDIDLKFAKRMR